MSTMPVGTDCYWWMWAILQYPNTPAGADKLKAYLLDLVGMKHSKECALFGQDANLPTNAQRVAAWLRSQEGK